MPVARSWSRGPLAALCTAALVLLTGCVQGDARNTSPDSIKVWI